MGKGVTLVRCAGNLVSQPPYPSKFKAGDVAISTESISFCDGTEHVPGQRLTVTDETQAYYNVWHHIYLKEGESVPAN